MNATRARRSGTLLGLLKRTYGLQAGVLGFHLGYYLVLPYLAVLLTRRGFSTAQVGTALGISSVIFQVSALAGGPLGDRLGRRLVMVLGLALRGIGLLWLGLAGTLPTVALAVGVGGIGAGLYAPAQKVALAAQAGDATAEAFAVRGIFANVGVTLGPLLGGAFLGLGAMWVFAAAAIANGLTALWTALTTPPDQRAEAAGAKVAAHPGPTPATQADEPELPTTRTAVVVLLGLSALLWALFTQLNLAVPLRAARILPADRDIGLLMAIASVTLILLQWPVTKLVTAWLRTPGRLAVGALLMGVGLGSVYRAGSFWWMAAALLVFTFGEMLAIPAADNAISLLAPPAQRGVFFGLSTFVWALGEGLGNFGGGLLLGYSRRAGLPALPWMLFALLGAGLAVGFWGLGRVRAAGPRVRS